MKTLLNPFEKYSEARLFMFGLVFTILGCLAGDYFNGKFVGTMTVSFSGEVGSLESFTDNGIDILSFWLFLFLLSKFINKRTRAIDILNTVLIARIPFFFLILLNCTGFFTALEAEMRTTNPLAINFSTSEMTVILVTGVVAITFLVWLIVLLYNGFKVASNVKSAAHKILFALAIILAEALAKYLTITFN